MIFLEVISMHGKESNSKTQNKHEIESVILLLMRTRLK